DTIKEVGEAQNIAATPDRSRMWIVQTPQTFRYRPLLDAYRSYQPPPYPTDDAVLLEQKGERLKMIEASYDNIKITTPGDLRIAEELLRTRTG
ncbi:MAG: 2-C-methyl-D-erythritol 4-phosphate cytidylyltransferase, partial [bacterium]